MDIVGGFCINLLKNENTQLFDLGVQPCDLLLINDQLISANYPDNVSQINDKDLKHLIDGKNNFSYNYYY